MKRKVYVVYLLTINFPDGTLKESYLGRTSSVSFEQAKFYNSSYMAAKNMHKFKSEYPSLVGPDACVKYIELDENNLVEI